MSYSASKQVFRDRYELLYHPNKKARRGRINNSLDTLSKVSLPSVGKFIPASILFEVKKTVEAVGKSAILSNDDVKRDTKKLLWPMTGWCQVRPLLFNSRSFPFTHPT